MKTTFIIGTRKSKLALCQSQLVQKQLQTRFPQLEFKLQPIVTEGDRNLHDSLQKIGGKGVFVKEIEHELLSAKIDFAVHSLKDVPPVLPQGLTIGAVPKRASAFDCLITVAPIKSLADLPQNARIGTNSLRREGQLLHARPDLVIVPIRGNVDTRLAKIASENLAGIVLAEAGLDRLAVDIAPYYRYSLQDVILPATGQGALAIECRQADTDTLGLLAAIHDAQTASCVQIERAFLKALGGSCNFPIGAYATQNALGYEFKGLVAAQDGTAWYPIENRGPLTAKLGKTAADTLIAQGALAALAVD
ncbi:MAG: hydroxymethylbilane synthase [Loigolactobacillus coryniformis]|jgi:hydroxymethylbilane synthase|uniref:Porphobilinogen deaminase n=1 Tax=Loigolactobacillus coryniformis subsp. coryniformis KCTC 3167 = DSM 20001 TaxID=913848 RepID=A0A0R1FBM9_9LACO|nr:hydroxymethylbilane synthase [Loigolactobacillus coryniformis]MDT3391060.1 hydroxymethylbilane synthase [Bacillota bacterium]OEH89700.1 porphobilinogen deaminase [Loigolactobacillus coryniformis subsp. coryniformis]RRG06275.1 MAG: hydroxymethylbilane synthase [Lactobacillus sp.]ATO54908.1 hydroxymethylbilane synthase [Loigolactobacillus coryniformis subsp. coryniformis KCTC 3167 = DSM 20001]KRK19021.1 porphobilinogen deaminase [Loigolactobacillus coryniformis subsp. coryniformis KCTC 3167 =